ncbi:2684_t:CDS:2 [Funneliformis mosseae]|uniref:2684_t:CDS:1 n=1 Tax=Funneliformis mosseae TaxID=27381 RepID=A0A9N9HK13_FUNMO|nr:2684_t:CDS:2 [Funneliformis mosseae]
MCSDNKDQISTNPSGDEPMAHIGKGCTALDGVGVVPSDTTLSIYAYNVAKDTIGSVLGTYQTSTTTEKAQDQKTDK